MSWINLRTIINQPELYHIPPPTTYILNHLYNDIKHHNDIKYYQYVPEIIYKNDNIYPKILQSRNIDKYIKYIRLNEKYHLIPKKHKKNKHLYWQIINKF